MIGFYLEEFEEKIFLPPRPKVKPRFKSSWILDAPKLQDLGEVIQIDKKYLVSIGVHAIHTPIILSRKEPVGWYLATQICNHLSFLLDTPVQAIFPNDKSITKLFFKDIHHSLIAKGIRFPLEESREMIQEHMKSIAEVVSSGIMGDEFSRLLPIENYPIGKSIGLQLIVDKNLERALHAYSEALISPTITGQILNFWRAIEAAEPNIKIQKDKFCDFKSYSFLPVYGIETFPRRGKRDWVARRRVNIIQKFKKVALRRWNNLLKTSIEPKELAEFLFKKRRHPSAHADNNILRAGHEVSFAELIEETLLLRVVARMFIEIRWKNCQK